MDFNPYAPQDPNPDWEEARRVAATSSHFTFVGDSATCKHCGSMFCLCGGCAGPTLLLEHECWLMWMAKGSKP